MYQTEFYIPVLFRLGNIDAQRLVRIVQQDHTVQRQRLLQVIEFLELHVAVTLKVIGLAVLHQPHALHLQVGKDLEHVALHQALRQVANVRQVRRLGGQRPLVSPANMNGRNLAGSIGELLVFSQSQ